MNKRLFTAIALLLAASAILTIGFVLLNTRTRIEEKKPNSQTSETKFAFYEGILALNNGTQIEVNVSGGKLVFSPDSSMSISRKEKNNDTLIPYSLHDIPIGSILWITGTVGYDAAGFRPKSIIFSDTKF